MASATAAGSAYATHGEPMIPFYIFYSMFGFQRTGDSIWAMADQLARGFLIGATAGRTTLTGEGLQHADGHSPLLAATNPAVVHYDPAFAYEVAHIMQDGLRRMYTASEEHPQGENVIFYLTVYNEPVSQPAEPEDLDVEGAAQGHLPLRRRPRARRRRRAAGAAARLGRRLPVDPAGPAAAGRRLGRGRRAVVGDLVERAGPRRRRGGEVVAEPPRGAGAGALRHDGRWPRPRVRWSRSATTCAPYPTRSRAGCPATTTSLGTDGFGFADTRPAARRFFQVDAESVVVEALRALAQRGEVKAEVVAEAFAKYRIDDPTAVADVKQEGGDA